MADEKTVPSVKNEDENKKPAAPKSAPKSAPEKDEPLTTLELEQRDHARTLARANGISVQGDEDEDELRAAAEERNEQLKKKGQDFDVGKANANPANWSFEDKGDGKVLATNRITGETYEGPAKDFGSRK